MGQAMPNIHEDEDHGVREANGSRWTKILPALVAAIVCTILIAEAVVTAYYGRANGDLMVIVCPILGATFLSIPAARAWWMVFSTIRGK
jgi:formate/nitrite transporter FocA (FNT family)